MTTHIDEYLIYVVLLLDLPGSLDFVSLRKELFKPRKLYML